MIRLIKSVIRELFSSSELKRLREEIRKRDLRAEQQEALIEQLMRELKTSKNS